MAKAVEVSIYKKAHLDFSFKCLHKLMEMAPMKDFAFSPDCIYEGLMMVYRASTHETREQLKKILKLPIHLGTKFWAMNRIVDKNNKFQNTDEFPEPDVYSRNHGCLINRNKLYRNNNYLTPENCKFFECCNIANLVSELNEMLRTEMQMHIPQPVEFNSFNYNMEFILMSGIWLKKDFLEPNICGNPSNYVSRKLSMLVTEIQFGREVSLIVLFPAVEQKLETNKWEVDENIFGLIERLTTEEGMDALFRLLNFLEARERLPEGQEIYPYFFELEQDLPINQLLEMLDIKHVLSPENSTLLGFTEQNLHLGGAKHHTYINVTPKSTIASAVNVFFTESGGSLTSIQEHYNCTQRQNSFIWLIFNYIEKKVLFIGVVNKDHRRDTAASSSAYV